jgi:hypothetical protein
VILRFPLVGLGVPPCWRAYFFLLRQEKVAKKKATPRSAPLRGSLRYSAGRASCLNSPAAQTRQAETSRPACVAQRLARGPKEKPSGHYHSPSFPCRRESRRWVDSRRRGNDGSRQLLLYCHGQPGKKLKNEIHSFSVDALPGPLRGAEQRRSAGGCRLALSEPQASFASRPAFRVAQGTGAAGTDPGSPSSLATFFLAKQEESTPASKAEPQA